MIGEGFFTFEIKFTKEGIYPLEIIFIDNNGIATYYNQFIILVSSKENINESNSTNNTNNTENKPSDPLNPVDPADLVQPVNLIDPEDPSAPINPVNPVDPTHNTIETSNNSTAKAVMKETGIPLMAILILLLSSLGLVYRKK